MEFGSRATCNDFASVPQPGQQMRVARLHSYPLTCCLEDLLRHRSCQKWVPTYRSVLRWGGVVGTDPAAPDHEQRGCRCWSVRARSGTEVRALDELETWLGLGRNISPPVPWAPCPGEITQPAVSGCAQARGCSALVCPSLGVGTRQHPPPLRWGGSDPRRGAPLPGAISFACRRLCSPCSCYLYSIFSSENGTSRPRSRGCSHPVAHGLLWPLDRKPQTPRRGWWSRQPDTVIPVPSGTRHPS